MRHTLFLAVVAAAMVLVFAPQNQCIACVPTYSIEVTADPSCSNVLWSNSQLSAYVEENNVPLQGRHIAFIPDDPNSSIESENEPAHIAQTNADGVATVTLVPWWGMAGRITVTATDLDAGEGYESINHDSCFFYAVDPTAPEVDAGGWAGATLHATWEPGYLPYYSQTAQYYYAIGTQAGYTDLVGWTCVSYNQGITRSLAGLGLQDGVAYYLSVKVILGTCESNIGSDAFTMDLSEPSTPEVTDEGATTTNNTQLYASWSSSDAQSDIAEYQFTISTSATDPTPENGTIVGWTTSGTDQQTGLPIDEKTVTDLQLPNGTYYFHVKARNGAGDWSAVGHSNGITVQAEYEAIVFSPAPSHWYWCNIPPCDTDGEWRYLRYCWCLGVTLSSNDTQSEIWYTVDGSTPETSPTAREYNRSGKVVVDPPQTVKAQLKMAGDTWGPVWQGLYSDDGCGSGSSGYSCYQWREDSPSAVYALRVDEIRMPKAIRVGWYNANGEFEVQRKLATDSTPWDQVAVLGTTTESAWDDVFDFATSTGYEYAVRTLPWSQPLPAELANLNPCQHSPEDPGCHPYIRTKWTSSGTRSVISVTPMEASLAENQTVDSRQDLRYVETKYVNHPFGDNVYRGGLFVGYKDTDDSSGIARSFLQFTGLQYPSGERLWASTVNAYHTRSLDTATTNVGCHAVGDNWDADSIAWAPTAAEIGRGRTAMPTVNVSNPQSVVSVAGTESGWCNWPIGTVASEMYGDHVLSVGLASTNETTESWAYFAKQQYDAELAPRLLYAYGVAPAFPMAILFSSPSVRGGETIMATVVLNSKAYSSGLLLTLSGSPCFVQMPATLFMTYPAITANFLISTAIVTSDTYMDISAHDSNQYGVTATLKITP